MKLKLTIGIAMLLLTSAITANAQGKGDAFRGVITYNVTYPNSNMDESQLAAMPKIMKVMLNGNKTRAEVTSGGINQILLTDSDAKTTFILADLHGSKMAIKANTASKVNKEPIVEPTNETKEIAGYVCKKANIHYGDERTKANPIVVYYTNEIGNNKLFYDNEYRNLDGIPLEFNYKYQGMNMLLTAVKIEKSKVSNREFEVPSDYKVTTPEEVRKMYGGM